MVFAPRAASSATNARPSPRAAPVTSTTESSIRMIPLLADGTARSQLAGAGPVIAEHVARVGQLAGADRQAAAADAAGQPVAQVLQLADAVVQVLPPGRRQPGPVAPGR